jgi:hypothetical protein
MTDLEVSRIAFGTWQVGGDRGNFGLEERLSELPAKDIVDLQRIRHCLD